MFALMAVIAEQVRLFILRKWTCVYETDAIIIRDGFQRKVSNTIGFNQSTERQIRLNGVYIWTKPKASQSILYV